MFNADTLIQLSCISLPVAPSNVTILSSVELAGQFTSQLQVQLSPLGIQKLRIAALLVPTFVTVAELPGERVVVVQTVIVAAAPSVPSVQSCHGSPLAPLGIVKLNTAALDVPELVTLALVQGSQVVVVHTVIVAAAQSAQSAPGVQGSHCSHLRFEY